MAKLLHEEITRDIIGAAFDVQKELGHGFLEKVYENAMILELQDRGRQTEQQVPIDVHYKKERIGHYVADLVVEEKEFYKHNTLQRATGNEQVYTHRC